MSASTDDTLGDDGVRSSVLGSLSLLHGDDVATAAAPSEATGPDAADTGLSLSDLPTAELVAGAASIAATVQTGTAPAAIEGGGSAASGAGAASTAAIGATEAAVKAAGAGAVGDVALDLGAVAVTPVDVEVAAAVAAPAGGAVSVAGVSMLAAAAPAADYSKTALLDRDGNVVEHGLELHALPTDTLFGKQWHLNNTGQSGGTPGVDINVTGIWDDGYSGAGVTVGVWDDGVEYTHPDLNDNYDTGLHITVGGVLHDPFPQSASSAHGTAVAGLIASELNGTGTVGVAHGATLGGVDMFFDPALDFERSFGELETFDVTNHSWGWTGGFFDNLFSGTSGGVNWTTYYNGWFESVATGRDGLGTLNFKSAGNSRTSGDDSNMSMTNSIPQTITVAAISHDNNVSFYSTPGASLLISAPSNGATGAGMWTTDRQGSAGYSNGSNEFGNTSADYTATFGGTSSAGPVAAGVGALILEANEDLGWRDVHKIFAYSSVHVGSAVGAGPSGNEIHSWFFNEADDWNGGGLHRSNDYGFGMVDAHAAVRLAETWTDQQTSANWVALVADSITPGTAIAEGSGTDFTFNTSEDVDLEFVGLKIDTSGGAFTGDFEIFLTSPEGTTSQLMDPNFTGNSVNGEWFYGSYDFWGEQSVGTWTLSMTDGFNDFTVDTLDFAQLEFYGAAADNDDTYIYTEEFSDYAGTFGHKKKIDDTDGGNDTLNAAAVVSDTRVWLDQDKVRIDGISFSTVQGVENVYTGDGNDNIRGNNDDNTLDGGRGNDKLYGKKGDDHLIDGIGKDVLSGLQGADILEFEIDGFKDKARGYEDNIDTIRITGDDSLAFSDLSFVDVKPGLVRVKIPGDKVLVLVDPDGPGSGTLSSADLTASDFEFFA